jgi:hypothetical protein
MNSVANWSWWIVFAHDTNEANIGMPSAVMMDLLETWGSTHGLPNILEVLFYVSPSCISYINGHNNYVSIVTFWKRMSDLDNHGVHNSVSTRSSSFLPSNWSCPALSVRTWCLWPRQSWKEGILPTSRVECPTLSIMTHRWFLISSIIEWVYSPSLVGQGE